MYTPTQKGIKNIEMFISLSGVRLLFWILSCLNILCTSSEKPCYT